ncbi:hypothetical protein KIN20_025699 [Parelaphostrongylus tenuis]|uniref:Uncharacterized protein n=1 Tax=Parelaphostrongylus tenuis TaxID=148309 RepID=A0AAD5QX42_PARTN|nr:hypothetical protein KIN20_025699 [Parelaphostrongylus tenuis]
MEQRIGFTTLPVAMAYTSMAQVPTRVSGTFVSRLVMRRVIDVLESQGRSALLPDAVIAAILDQLIVTTTYEQIHSQTVILDLTMDMSGYQ